MPVGIRLSFYHPMKSVSLFQLYPLVPLVISLMLGIAVGHAFILPISVLTAIFVVSVLSSLFTARHSLPCTLLIIASSFVLGALLVTMEQHRLDVTLPNEYVEFDGVVLDEPIDKGKYLRADLFVTSGVLRGYRVRMSLSKGEGDGKEPSVTVGDGLRLCCRLKHPTNFSNSNFDYVTYLRGRGIVAQAYVPRFAWQQSRVDVSSLPMVSRARLVAMQFRHRLLQRFSRLGLSGQNFAVVSAMTLGDKSAVSEEIREAYSVSGASHILALSGMHLGIVYTLLSFLFAGRRRSAVSNVLLVLAIWAYVFVVGMSSSVVRSAVMLSVYAFLCIAGRQSMSLNALAFAALLMLLISPLSLFDIGFELSFLAVAFILLYNQRLCGLVPYDYQQHHPLIRFVWQLLCMSLIAQIGTSPMVAYYFGRFSVYFLLTNLVVIPAATVIIYGTVLMLALTVLPSLQAFVSIVLAFVVNMLNAILLWISSLPYASFDNIHVNALQVALVYIVIFILLHLLLMRRRVR